MASSVVSTVAVAPVAQFPLMPTTNGQAAATAVYRPMTLDSLKHIPAIAARAPQAAADKVCFHIAGPDRCNDVANLTYEDLAECEIVFDDCDKLHKRASVGSGDYGTDSDSGDDHEDTYSDDADASDSDDDDDEVIFDDSG